MFTAFSIDLKKKTKPGCEPELITTLGHYSVAQNQGHKVRMDTLELIYGNIYQT